ncbi:MAG: DoxX family protein [Candidatus Parcubacteria bacterium]|nr:DoxX family protein [Candidatus Parcubacteria bacterium]
MLSLFQQLFDFQFLALGALRVIIALIFIVEGYKKFPKKSEKALSEKRHIYKIILSCFEFISGLFLLAGLFTQAAAVLLSFVTIKRIYNQYLYKPTNERNLSFYLLLLAVTLFFLFSGPGAYGIDYPL